MRNLTDIHAALSADAYNAYPREKWREGVVVSGGRYEILDQVSRPSGYQGTMYRNTETGEMVVAHRGTEFDRELVRDGIIADGGMVVVGANRQENDALAFTRGATILFIVMGIVGLIPIAVVKNLYGTLPLYGNNVWLHFASAAIGVFFSFRPGYNLTDVGTQAEMNPHMPNK